MSKNEIKLTENINEINIDVIGSDISIYEDKKTQLPIVRTIGDISVHGNKVIIKENSNNTNSINFSNGNTTIILGSNITFNGNTFNSESSSIEIIIPQNSKIQDIEIKTKSGDIKGKNLFFQKLVAKTMSGDITLKDIDILFTSLKTMSGDIKVEILESIINYETYLKSMSGDTIQNSIEKNTPTLLKEKYELEASSMSGDIEILFKGKR